MTLRTTVLGVAHLVVGGALSLQAPAGYTLLIKELRIVCVGPASNLAPAVVTIGYRVGAVPAGFRYLETNLSFTSNGAAFKEQCFIAVPRLDDVLVSLASGAAGAAVDVTAFGARLIGIAP